MVRSEDGEEEKGGSTGEQGEGNGLAVALVSCGARGSRCTELGGEDDAGVRARYSLSCSITSKTRRWRDWPGSAARCSCSIRDRAEEGEEARRQIGRREWLVACGWKLGGAEKQGGGRRLIGEVDLG